MRFKKIEKNYCLRLALRSLDSLLSSKYAKEVCDKIRLVLQKVDVKNDSSFLNALMVAVINNISELKMRYFKRTQKTINQF